jgi:signal transduction histidine kinase
MKNLSDSVLEGMIHNIRTPLNLIMAYAQQQKKLEVSELSEKILSSALKIDDMLQETWEAVQSRSPEREPVSLESWLNSELKLINCILPFKHRLLIDAVSLNSEVKAQISTLYLSVWVESLLDMLIRLIPIGQIKISVSILSNSGQNSALVICVSSNEANWDEIETELKQLPNSERIPACGLESRLTDDGLEIMVLL